MIGFRLRQAVWASSLLVAAVQQAAAAPVEARFEVSNLSYTLADLQADDGIAPSFTALPSTASSSFFGKSSNDFNDASRVQFSESQSWTLLDDRAENFAMANGHVTGSKLGNSVTVSTQLPADSLVHLGEASNSLVLQSYCQYPAPVCLRDGYAYGQLKSHGDFTLTAHTRVTLVGNVKLDAWVDGPETALAAQTFLAAHPGTALDVLARSLVDITVNSGQQLFANGHLSWEANAEKTFGPSFDPGVASAHDTRSEAFTFEFSNDTDHDISVGLRMVGFDYNIVTLTGAVPEPSTWAMMAIGLVGMGTLSARRRLTKAS